MRGCWTTLILVPLALAMPGCSGTPLSLTGLPDPAVTEVPAGAQPGGQPAKALATSSLSIPVLNMASLGGNTAERVEPPVEIYSRIARGALKCWFGTQGSLKKTHVFHADVAPASSVGGAEIAIYERDASGQTPRSVRAYRITIARSGEGSNTQPENFRMPEAVARDMTADVARWIQGPDDCSVVGLGGWTAKPGKEETLPVVTKKAEKTKR